MPCPPVRHPGHILGRDGPARQGCGPVLTGEGKAAPGHGEARASCRSRGARAGRHRPADPTGRRAPRNQAVIVEVVERPHKLGQLQRQNAHPDPHKGAPSRLSHRSAEGGQRHRPADAVTPTATVTG